MYLPVRSTTLRQSLDHWFDSHKIEPVILAEFEDRELLKTFGGGGLAAFPAAAMIESQVRNQFGADRIGWIRGVRETYYAISVHRRALHPVLQRLFARVAKNPQLKDEHNHLERESDN